MTESKADGQSARGRSALGGSEAPGAPPDMSDESALVRRLQESYQARAAACQREIDAVCRKHGFRLRVSHVISLEPSGKTEG